MTAEIFFGKIVLGQRSQLFQTIELFCKKLKLPFSFYIKLPERQQEVEGH